MNFSPRSFSQYTSKMALRSAKTSPNVFTIQVLHILDDLKTIKQRIQEIDEQILVRLCSKNTLKTEIGKQANISFLYPFHIHLLLKLITELWCKNKLFSWKHKKNSKKPSSYLQITQKQFLLISSKTKWFALTWEPYRVPLTRFGKRLRVYTLHNWRMMEGGFEPFILWNPDKHRGFQGIDEGGPILFNMKRWIENNCLRISVFYGKMYHSIII